MLTHYSSNKYTKTYLTDNCFLKRRLKETMSESMRSKLLRSSSMTKMILGKLPQYRHQEEHAIELSTRKSFLLGTIVTIL